MWFADKLLVENPFKCILIYSQNYSNKMSMLASLICSFSSSSSSLPCFSLQCLQLWKKSKTRITWQLPASRQRREQCGGCRTGRASSWGWAASAPSSAWSPGSPGAGWVHNSWPFDATWSLLVEKTSWKVESAMSGVIPITSFFKLRQALSKRTRRGSGQGQEMENCKLVIWPQNKPIDPFYKISHFHHVLMVQYFVCSHQYPSTNWIWTFHTSITANCQRGQIAKSWFPTCCRFDKGSNARIVGGKFWKVEKYWNREKLIFWEGLKGYQPKLNKGMMRTKYISYYFKYPTLYHVLWCIVLLNIIRDVVMPSSLQGVNH